MKKYVRFTETNTWEGEFWHFFLEANDPIDEHVNKQIAEIVKGSSSFKLDLKKKYTETEVDYMISREGFDFGYMPVFNKVTRILPEDWKGKTADEIFYKGRAFQVEKRS